MRAGLLDEIIDIYSLITEKSDYGQTINTYVSSYNTKARVQRNTGFRSVQNDEKWHGYDIQFTVRYYVPITFTDQIHFQNEIYRIISIIKDRESNSIIIEAERVNE
jgi:SPP1 family predicted phage head-tail adaptor